MIIHIMTSGLSEESRRIIDHFEYRYTELSIHYINMEQDVLSKLSVHGEYISSETWYRLRLAQLLPSVDRILYLDADLIVCKNLTDFFQTDLTGWLMAGVEDSFLKRKGYKRMVGLTDSEVYINAGVILMNLAEMRAQNADRAILEFGLQNSEKLRFNDQDAINIVCRGKIKPMKMKYNYTTSDVKKKPWGIPRACIVHFTGAKKPWHPDCDNYFTGKWKSYASKYQEKAQKLRIAVIRNWQTTPIPAPPENLIHAEIVFVDEHLPSAQQSLINQGDGKKISIFLGWLLSACSISHHKRYDACINYAHRDNSIKQVESKCSIKTIFVQTLSDTEIKAALRNA